MPDQQIPATVVAPLGAREFHLGRLADRRAALIETYPPAVDGAVCDGWALVTIPSPDGPEHYSCHGCRSCTPADPAPARARVTLPTPNDEEF